MSGVTVAHPRVSFADLEQWPEDGRRYELYDGEVYVVPSPIPLHQMVSARLHPVLEEYTRAHGGVVLYAPLDIVLTDFDVVQPDLLLFTRAVSISSILGRSLATRRISRLKFCRPAPRRTTAGGRCS